MLFLFGYPVLGLGIFNRKVGDGPTGMSLQVSLESRQGLGLVYFSPETSEGLPLRSWPDFSSSGLFDNR